MTGSWCYDDGLANSMTRPYISIVHARTPPRGIIGSKHFQTPALEQFQPADRLLPDTPTNVPELSVRKPLTAQRITVRPTRLANVTAPIAVSHGVACWAWAEGSVTSSIRVAVLLVVTAVIIFSIPDWGSGSQAAGNTSCTAMVQTSQISRAAWTLHRRLVV